MVVSNANNTGANDINGIKGWFEANAIDYSHHFHGNMSVWSSLGYDGYIPFNVLIDRDGMVRKIGGAATSSDWATAVEELSGTP